MTQIQANEYSNSSFMATKDVIMFRIFQLVGFIKLYKLRMSKEIASNRILNI